MSGHVIVWELDDGVLRGTVECREEPSADCRLDGGPGCQCEAWTVQRDACGPFHMTGDYGGGGTQDRHDMRSTDYCNIETFLNESDDLNEMYQGRFVLAATAIEPVWQGDYYEWKPVST